jgi:hypothetical protein
MLRSSFYLGPYTLVNSMLRSFNFCVATGFSPVFKDPPRTFLALPAETLFDLRLLTLFVVLSLRFVAIVEPPFSSAPMIGPDLFAS